MQFVPIIIKYNYLTQKPESVNDVRFSVSNLQPFKKTIIGEKNRKKT